MLAPSFHLMMILWFALRRTFLEGGILTLMIGSIAELHSGCPRGFFLLTSMATYLLVRALSRSIILTDRRHYIFLTISSSVFHKLFTLMIVFLIGKGDSLWRTSLSLLFPNAVFDALLAYPIYRFLDRFDWKTFKNPRAREIQYEELVIDHEDF